MLTILTNLHFLRPLWLLALLPLVVLLAGYARWQTRGSDWAQACDAHLLPHLLLPASSHSALGGLWLMGGGGLLAILALSGPSWEQYPHALYHPPAAQVLVLSLDESMQATDQPSSRLERAKDKISDLLAASGRQSALVVYTDAAFSVVPLTYDSATIRQLLPVLEPDLMPALGNRPEQGLRQAQALLSQAGINTGQIILISDRGSPAATTTARELARHGHQVSVLAVSNPAGHDSPFDPSGLQAIAQAGGGIYATLRHDNADVQALLAATPRSDTTAGDSTALRWRDRGPWLVVLLLPLAALAFRQAEFHSVSGRSKRPNFVGRRLVTQKNQQPGHP